MEKAVVEVRNRVVEKKEELVQLNGEIQVDKELAEFFKKGRLRYSRESKQDLCDRALEMMEDHKNEAKRYCELAIDACVKVEKSMDELVRKLANASASSQEVNEEVTAQGSENSLASRNGQNAENGMQNVILQELRRMGREMAEIREKVERNDTEQAIRQSLQEANRSAVRRIDERRSPSDHQRRPVEERQSRSQDESGQYRNECRENGQGNRSPCESMMVGLEAVSVEERNANAMISMAMPPVGEYKGEGGLGKFYEFLESLEMKYSLVSDDKRMYSLLKSHLEGEARLIFDSFARKSVKGYGAMKEKMREKLRGDETMKEYDETKEWETASVREGESVSSLCMRLERLASRALPGMPDEYLAPMLAKKLLMQLTGWIHYRELIEVMEGAYPREKYEAVKAHSMRIETVEKRGTRLDAGFRTQPVQMSCERREQNHGVKREEIEYGRPLEYHSSRHGRNRQEYREPENYNARSYQNSQNVAFGNAQNQSQRQNQQQMQKAPSGLNFGMNQEVRPSGGAGGMAYSPQCYKCGGRGHVQKNCPNPMPRERETKEHADKPVWQNGGNDGKQEKDEEQFNERRSYVVKLKRKASGEKDEFWAALPEVKIKLNGMKLKAIVDTGSEVSMIPANLLTGLKKLGTVENVEVKEEIIEVAGTRLDVVEKGILTIDFCGIAKPIGMFAISNGTEIILGQNVIEKWGRVRMLNLDGEGNGEFEINALDEKLEQEKQEVNGKDRNKDAIDEGKPLEEENEAEVSVEEHQKRLQKTKYLKCLECGGLGHGKLICPTRKKRLSREMKRENWRKPDRKGDPDETSRVIDVKVNTTGLKKDDKKELVDPVEQLRKMAKKCLLGEQSMKNIQRRIKWLSGDDKSSAENEELLRELIRWTSSDDDEPNHESTTKGRKSSDYISSDCTSSDGISSVLVAASNDNSSENDGRSFIRGDFRQHFTSLYHHPSNGTFKRGGRGRPH